MYIKITSHRYHQLPTKSRSITPDDLLRLFVMQTIDCLHRKHICCILLLPKNWAYNLHPLNQLMANFVIDYIN